MVGPGPDAVEAVARKLALELGVLHGKVVESGNAVFRPPRSVTTGETTGKEVNGHRQNGQSQMGQQTPQGIPQRGIRAVSLPPMLPDHNAVEGSQQPEPMQVEKPKHVDESKRMDRELGGGQPQYQPYWYPLQPYLILSVSLLLP